MDKTIHHGRNIERIRKVLNIKQEGLAGLLGDDWTQKKISLLESKEEIEPEILEQVAKALKVTPDSIRNFSEEAAINIISNTFSSHDNSVLHGINYHPTFNPIDKVVELLERMIKEKNEEIEKLRQELGKK